MRGIPGHGAILAPRLVGRIGQVVLLMARRLHPANLRSEDVMAFGVDRARKMHASRWNNHEEWLIEDAPGLTEWIAGFVVWVAERTFPFMWCDWSYRLDFVHVPFSDGYTVSTIIPEKPVFVM